MGAKGSRRARSRRTKGFQASTGFRASVPMPAIKEEPPPPKQGSKKALRLRRAKAAEFLVKLSGQSGAQQHPSWDEPDVLTPCSSNVQPGGEMTEEEEREQEERDFQSARASSYAAFGTRPPSKKELRLRHQAQVAPKPTLADHLPVLHGGVQ